MAMMLTAALYGGWSDAIRWDVMEPSLKIRPLGEVHAKLGFVNDVLAPFARVTTDMRTEEAIEGYSSNLMPSDDRSLEDVFESQFLAAWREEAGATLDEFLSFIGYLEKIGMDKNEAVLMLPRSELLSVTLDKGSLPAETSAAIAEFLTLRTRPKWREVPDGYTDADRQPWRFRRRLSLLRKPLLQIDETDDPTFIVAPGLLRDALTYMVGNYHRGDFPQRQLRSAAMRSWAGTLRDRAGKKFSKEVAGRMKELGWEAESEVKVTKLLQRGFDRDYGDVDVLAWNQASGRILVIECKDVQYRKTHGEIAEQLADFRGELWPDGRRDYLLRHLDRIDILSQHLPALAKYIGMAADGGVESHLIFKNPVPMEFALKHMAERVSVGIFDRLATI
jgi:hypothetical protein